MKNIVQQAVRRYKLPGLSVAVAHGSPPHFYSVAVGVKKIDCSFEIDETNKFAVASCTKPMTATLAALAVQENKIQWKSTVLEAFPDLYGSIHSDYKFVTLAQLLSHYGGMPVMEKDDPMWRSVWNLDGAPEDQRKWFLTKLLARTPPVKPGAKFLYSNAGYALAGSMLERAYGLSWEQLIQDKIFVPLAMNSGGFGVPDCNGDLREPWGHRDLGGSYIPVDGRAPFARRPIVMAPAGAVICSPLDLCKFGLVHLNESRELLSRNSKEILHSSRSHKGYALGWNVLSPCSPDGIILGHEGTNTMFTSVITISIARTFVLVVLTNCGGATALKACRDVAKQIICKLLDNIRFQL